MDPDGSVWSLRIPWGLPGASWGPEGPRKGGKGGFTLGSLPISPSGANRLHRLPISLRGPKRAIGPGWEPPHRPNLQIPYFGSFFMGLKPWSPFFELGRPVASRIQPSFLILVGFGLSTIKIHVGTFSLVYAILVLCMGY